ncbi:response regulator transcription factor [Streptomyces anulatus]|uniref:response regulator transcription factor n=1 Tax=Streptomyces anulatus TaxID=1892 RepID=UPI002E0F3F5F|nr:LuxR C-terminal-related transcriptional regulator [Streptomyces anulatus]WSI82878.1 LuxR C-terminal-related transcriptional regulator [Streptomyces anulatus]
MTAPARVGPSPSGGGPAVSLSPRQSEVLQHAANGLTIPETAHTMHLAVSTVHYHQQVILTALRARNMANAVLLACQAGVLDGRPRRHGDHAGFAAHVYRGEEPCEVCWVGERAYRAKRREARKVNAA